MAQLLSEGQTDNLWDGIKRRREYIYIRHGLDETNYFEVIWTPYTIVISYWKGMTIGPDGSFN